jgi:hypothetical protein
MASFDLRYELRGNTLKRVWVTFTGYNQDKKLNSVAFSPQAKYTDRATATFANFCGYRVSRGQSNEFPRRLVSVF